MKPFHVVMGLALAIVAAVVLVRSRSDDDVGRSVGPATSDELQEVAPQLAGESLLEPQPIAGSAKPVALPPTPELRARLADEPIQPVVVEPEVDPRDFDYPPANGIAATAILVIGGPDAFEAAYVKYGAAEREERMIELEAALAEYVHGDPRDEAGRARYGAFKDELHWWQEHRR